MTPRLGSQLIDQRFARHSASCVDCNGMFDRLLNRLRIRTWRLRGYDTFAVERYELPGRFFSVQAALRAARRQLVQLEKLQPTATSGGQDGIQDQVYLVRPDGTLLRCLPDTPLRTGRSHPGCRST
jgi:hypothetical protein